MNSNTQIIKGTNTYLIPITENDTENIIKWRNQPFVRENFIEQTILTKKRHEEWLKNKVNTGLVKQFIIYFKDTETAIGTTYLRDIDKKNENAEYGIFIGEEKYLGLGLGKEVTKLMMEFASDELGLHKVRLRVLAHNKYAIKCYLRNGFAEEGRFKDEVKLDGEWRDVIFMGKIVGRLSKN